MERKQANSLRHNKGEAQKITLPFKRFQGLKFYPMNQNPFRYLSDVFSIIAWMKTISKAAPLPSQNFALAGLQMGSEFPRRLFDPLPQYDFILSAVTLAC